MKISKKNKLATILKKIGGDVPESFYRGPKGERGESIVGPRGPSGKNGTDGKDGAQGPKGDTGKDAAPVDIKEVADELRPDILKRLQGAGNANRNIQVEGVNVLRPYTDINLVGTSSSILAATDNQNKVTIITIPTGGGGGTPSAPDTSVQFNDGGSFGGDASFVWDKIDKVLTLTGEDFAKITAGYSTVDSDQPLSLLLTGANAVAMDKSGGNLRMIGGNATGNEEGGKIRGTSGDGGDTGTGGAVEFEAGVGGATSGSGGSISLTAGSAQGGDSDGGGVTITAGHKTGAGIAGNLILNAGSGGDTGTGGSFYANGGNGGSTSGAGGELHFAGGNGVTEGNGGSLFFGGGYANSGVGSNFNGGDIYFTPGNKINSGNDGQIHFQNPSSGLGAIFDTSLLSSDKTFTFPDQSGTFALTSDLPSGAALTKTDDTNVTLSLGGSPSTALVNAASLTLGWTGQLAASRGGTGATTLLGAGISAKTSTVSATGQTADIGSTNLTTTGAGLYRLAYYLVDSTADLTAGAVRLNVAYTDNGASQTQQSAVVALTILGTFTQGVLIIQLASGNIAYSTTHTGAFGASKYDLFITLERLN